MSRFELKIYCTNPRCDRPENSASEQTCANCGTTITYRYLWAIEPKERPIGSIVGNGRYKVVSPRLWLDLQPGLVPFMPAEIPEPYLAYLHLYDYRLHLPEIYGVCQESGQETLLLENVPFDRDGTPYPGMMQSFGQSSAVRQVYYLWQMLELWEPMLNWQVASSLLLEENLRVQDWRLRLRELTPDSKEPSLSELASLWSGLLPETRSSITTPLQEICVQMHDPKVELPQIRKALNQLLLEQAGLLSLGLQAQGITDVGKVREHNEDTCYPLNTVIQDDLFPRLAIVCDGIGGHEGGEVASHMAVQAFKPQIRAFLAELAEQPELVEPDLICDQLAAITRVVNNLISSQNDEQERSDRRRMGTTLMMTLQVPQRVRTSSGTILSNSHELYLVSVGDSRAYWLTPRNLHQLSIDDDVSVREVRLGRSTYRDALMRPDAGALTQALGTRDSESLRPRVQRFLLEEDGLLLICSDGLSDMNLIEQHWQAFADKMRSGESLEESAQAWVDLANEKNGSDNISLVLTQFQVTDPTRKIPFKPSESEDDRPIEPDSIPQEPDPKKKANVFLWSLLIILLGGGAALGTWFMVDQKGFESWRDRLQNEVQPRIQNLLPKP
jgi:protein phosphatase